MGPCVYLHFHRFGSIDQRIELLEEAGEYAREEAESQLLAAVSASPRGRDVLLEGNTHLGLCKSSRSILLRLHDILQHAGRTIQEAIEDNVFSLNDDEETNKLLACFSKVREAFDENISLVVEDFRLAASDESVQRVLSSLLGTLRSTILQKLTPILNNTVSEQSLITWRSTFSMQVERFDSLAAVIKVEHPLWSVDSCVIFIQEIEACRHLCNFFCRASALITPGAAEMTEEEAVSLVKVFRTCSTLSFQDAEVSSAVSACLGSPLLDSQGPIIAPLVTLSTGPAKRLAEDIIKSFQGIFPRIKPHGVKALPHLDAATAKQFSEFKVPSDIWSRASQCAATSGDSRFGRDIQRMQCFENAVVALGAVHTLSLAIFKPGVKYPERACNEANCKVVSKFILACSDLSEALEAVPDGGSTNGGMMSCDHLRSICDWTVLEGALATAKAEQLHRFSTCWTSDIQTFSRAIRENIVDISQCKDTFLQEEEIMKKLIGNVEGFNKLPKACSAVHDVVTAVKKHLPRHERVVDKAAFSDARHLADQGVENVVFTMVAYYFKEEFPKAKSLVVIQRLTKEIRDHAKGHHVPLTEAIQKRLDDLDSGAAGEIDVNVDAGPSPDRKRSSTDIEPQALGQPSAPSPTPASAPDVATDGGDVAVAPTPKKRRFSGLTLD